MDSIFFDFLASSPLAYYDKTSWHSQIRKDWGSLKKSIASLKGVWNLFFILMISSFPLDYISTIFS